MFLGLNLTWHWSPGALIFIILLCLLYVLGIRYGQRRDARVVLKPHHIVAFVTCVVVMALLLLTPLDTLARTQLFVAHMVQVVFLVTLCAPLFLFACPEWFWQPVLQWSPTRGILSKLTSPFLASLIFNLTFFIWHAPRPFHYALQHGSVYHIELLSLFLASLLNWWPLIGSVHELRNLSYPLQMLYAFLDGQPVDIFAFLLVFTGAIFYPYYQIPAPLAQLGLTAYPLQAAGGAFLMIPGIIDLIIMTPLFFHWLGQVEARAKIADQKMQEELEEEAALAALEESQA